MKLFCFFLDVFIAVLRSAAVVSLSRYKKGGQCQVTPKQSVISMDFVVENSMMFWQELDL